MPCAACHGYRLKPEALCVKIGAKHIGEISELSVKRAAEWFETVPAALNAQQNEIAARVLKEIRERLTFLVDVGLNYLTLSRSSGTLSGGESQRIRLASQIGSGLTGVLYVLDEPSIGLHQRDNARLLETLKRLRDLGNTVIVVEHDEDAIRLADHVLDIGPGAGMHGGHIVAHGTPADIMRNPNSLTGKYLTGELAVEVPERRPPNHRRTIKVINARGNNLKNISAEIPLGLFTCVTGVSGGGKSTLLIDTLYKAIARKLNGASEGAAPHDRIEGLEHIDKIIDIDQSPIGRTPRSNPATYTGAFTPIREWFAGLPEAKARGYEPGRFSFNVKGGRCEACQGDGVIKIEMHFLPDVYVTCDVCKGKRYNRETLEVLFKGKSIADVLDMTVEEAAEFFKAVPRVRETFKTLHRVGLDYIHVGQQATTLSGGEAQRVKLAKELSKRATGRTLYILDEPTTGLHFHDVKKLLEVLHELVAQGNTVVVIEHNLEVIKTADWVIDLGPEGGDGGGEIVAWGTPEDIVKAPRSYTGKFLAPVLKKAGKPRRRRRERGGGVGCRARTQLSDTLARIQALVARGLVRISDHGFDELAKDDIAAGDVVAGVREAELVEDYPTATKGPSVLVRQRDASAAIIHAVWAIQKIGSSRRFLFTAYRPDPDRWSSRLHEAESAMSRTTIKLIHEGRYAAEVPVELIEDDTGWSPYLSLGRSPQVGYRSSGTPTRRCRRSVQTWKSLSS